jgi:hypothetical protein
MGHKRARAFNGVQIVWRRAGMRATAPFTWGSFAGLLLPGIEDMGRQNQDKAQIYSPKVRFKRLLLPHGGTADQLTNAPAAPEAH